MRKIFHPWLLAIFPTLFLFQHNIDQTNVSETVLPLLITVLFVSVLWRVLLLVLKDLEKSGVLVSLFLVLFFSFGHIFNLVKNLWGLPNIYQLLLYLQICLFLVALYLSWKTERKFKNVTSFLNISSAILVIISLFNCLWFVYATKTFESQHVAQNGQSNISQKPDIYYIIMDGYARNDTLKSIYNYDNKLFLSFLRDKGFFVADKSRSNYPQTYLSLASSLNLAYLDFLQRQLGEDYRSRTPLKKLIRNNSTTRFLKKQGYQFWAFSTGYSGTELTNADYYLAPNKYSISEFQQVWMNTTPLVKISYAPILNLIVEDNHTAHRKRILYTLDKMGNLRNPVPKFVFAHLVCPHPPFVFDRQGNLPQHTFSLKDHEKKEGKNVQWYIEGYRNQVDFLNQKLQNTINKILKKSHNSIIIIQADHGPSLQTNWKNHKATNLNEKFNILNAYYFPNQKYQNLYPEISPVNSFRIILNDYFSLKLDLLPDESYFASWAYPYNFIKITEEDFGRK
ncbi:sulfatase-like hydrolase/transferase [Candidatus Uabimicrobium sp. HlEnr_7]|uniref:sulfatase-like hydrolase/transferase n=1 Tax=Candidatus Uabimicrobium helgolandensis TaxID=3095367 RepID=UPI003557FCA1